MINKKVHVNVDRPIGSAHPNYKNLVYEVNYGYIPGVMGRDGEEQDAYILGIEEPIEEFDGVVIAVIHRKDDNEDKWVVAPENTNFTNDEIMNKIQFQEKYFSSQVERK